MAKTVLNVKTDVAVKKAAQKLAKEIGVPLSTIVNAHLKRFIEDRRVEFQAPLVPNARLRKVIERAETDARKGDTKNYSPAFDNVDDAIAWLES